MNEKEIQQVRDFNRFYTSFIGVLDRHYLDSPFSLPEGRVLFELNHLQPCKATDLIDIAKMDKGYVSRILKSFEKKGLLSRKPSKEDGRAMLLSLSAKGEKEFNKINNASFALINSQLRSLNKKEAADLINHMKAIKNIITKATSS
ncbi:MAG: MarR family winged helix-turn-helix transcriptional regulator [Cyclobacteriaceae bacterium]